jgi:hypothetical protein
MQRLSIKAYYDIKRKLSSQKLLSFSHNIASGFQLIQEELNHLPHTHPLFCLNNTLK